MIIDGRGILKRDAAKWPPGRNFEWCRFTLHAADGTLRAVIDADSRAHRWRFNPAVNLAELEAFREARCIIRDNLILFPTIELEDTYV